MRPPLGKVTVGQKVIVHKVYWKREEITDGTVTKVGRAWVTVEAGGRDHRFRLDTQNTGSGSSCSDYFRTPEQEEHKERTDADRATLREALGTFISGGTWGGSDERRALLAKFIRDTEAQEAAS